MRRNFWAQINAEGGPPVATGSDERGGLAVDVMRLNQHGELESAVRVVGHRDDDTLTLDVYVGDELVHHERTVRPFLESEVGDGRRVVQSQ